MISFHKPYLNNFNEIYINRIFSVDNVKDERQEAVSHLNDIVYGIYLIVRRNIRWFVEKVSDQELENIRKVLQIWDTHVKNKNYFLTVECIEYFFGLVNLSTVEFTGFSELIDRLVDVPTQLRAFLHVNFYSEPPLVKLLNNKKVSSNIESVEYLRSDILIPNKERMPIAKVIFCCDVSHAPKEEFVKKLGYQLQYPPNIKKKEMAFLRYEAPLTNGCSITQGFAKYKKLIEITGQIDYVYEREWNYAFLKENKISKE